MWFWICFLIGFCIDFFMSWGSEGGAEVVEKWCIWSSFLIGFLNGFLYIVLENSGRAPYPTPKLGISARHAVSNLSGCGVGAPNPIVNPAMWKPARKNFVGQGSRPK